MSKFHFNPETGYAGPCSADPSNPAAKGCPFKDQPHFNTKAEARDAAESHLANKFLSGENNANPLRKNPNNKKYVFSDEEMFLVYRDEHGKNHEQPWGDVCSSGTLIDPDSGDDMEIVGWATPDATMTDYSDMYLVYEDSKGGRHEQPWSDVTYSGSLIDPDTGDDMEIVGWETNAYTRLNIPSDHDTGILLSKELASIFDNGNGEIRSVREALNSGSFTDKKVLVNGGKRVYALIVDGDESRPVGVSKALWNAFEAPDNRTKKDLAEENFFVESDKLGALQKSLTRNGKPLSQQKLTQKQIVEVNKRVDKFTAAKKKFESLGGKTT